MKILRKSILLQLVILLFAGCTSDVEKNGYSKSAQTRNDSEGDSVTQSSKPHEDPRLSYSQKKKKASDIQKEKPKVECGCKGFVDWETDEAIVIYENPGGNAIDTLLNDLKNEDFLIFEIKQSRDDFFLVDIAYSIRNKRTTGWIKKKTYFGLYSKNHNPGKSPLFIYAAPDRSSEKVVTIKKYNRNMYTIIDCDNRWAKVRLNDNNGNSVTGWLEPEMQCDNPYSACN